MTGGRSRAMVGVATLAFAAVLTAPALYCGAVFGDDLYHHLVWSSLFNEQLGSGQIYPRWLFNANAGFGGPVFFFYGPVPFYVCAAISSLGIDVPRQLGVAAFLSVSLSGVAAYCWARMIGGTKAALAASLLYMALPYHINVDLYQRFAFGELWSFVWLPLVLAATHAIASGATRAITLLAVAYALLIATHMPTTLIFSVIPPVYCLVVATDGRRLKRLLQTSAGMALGIGLAAVYLLPAMGTQRFASFAHVSRSFDADTYLSFDLALTHIRSIVLFDGGSGASRDLVAYAALMGFVVAAGFFVATLRKALDPTRRLQAAFWMATAAVSLLMMHRWSSLLWTAIPLLQRVQFPWRFNVLVALSVIPLVALGWPEKGFATSRVARVFATLMAAWGIAFWIPSAKAVHWGLAKGAGASDLGQSFLAPEYRPASVPVAEYSPATLHGLATTMRKAQFVSASGTVSLDEWDIRRIVLKVASPTGGLVQLQQFYYPGWRALVDSSVEIATTPSAAGLLLLDMPPGTHDVLIERERLSEESIGWGITVAASLSLVALAAVRPGRSGRSGRNRGRIDTDLIAAN